MSRASRLSSAKVALTGQKMMFKNLDLLSSVLGPKSYASALIKIMVHTQLKAMGKTPVDTGYLRASARSVLKGSSEDGASGSVYYTAPYATEVHETHRTKSKYLAEALKEVSQVLEQEIGATIKLQMFSKDMPT